MMSLDGEKIDLTSKFDSPSRQKSFLVRVMKNIHAFVCVAVAAVSLLACGKSKIDQCNAFIEQANASQTTISALNFESEDPATLEAAAGKIEADAKKVEAVELKDEKLAGFKTSYVKNLNSLAKTSRDLAGVHKDAKDPAKASAVEAKVKTVVADAEKLEKDESKLVDDINAYCSAN